MKPKNQIFTDFCAQSIFTPDEMAINLINTVREVLVKDKIKSKIFSYLLNESEKQENFHYHG